MPKATQFDLALTRPRAAPTPRKLPASPLASGPAKFLHNRRLRLHRLMERTQGTIAEIEAELRRRGVAVAGPPRHHGKAVPLRHNELPRLCLNALRAAGRPMHVREIASCPGPGRKGPGPARPGVGQRHGEAGAGLPAAAQAEGDRAAGGVAAGAERAVGAGGYRNPRTCGMGATAAIASALA